VVDSLSLDGLVVLTVFEIPFDQVASTLASDLDRCFRQHSNFMHQVVKLSGSEVRWVNKLGRSRGKNLWTLDVPRLIRRFLVTSVVWMGNSVILRVVASTEVKRIGQL